MNLIHHSATRAACFLGALAHAAVMLSGLAATPAAAGPIGFQAAGGWYTESDEFYLNAGAAFGAGSIRIIPNADWVFVESGSLWSLNVDATMSVLPLAVANIYAGGGLGWVTSDPENGESDTQTVVNLIAGTAFSPAPAIRLTTVCVSLSPFSGSDVTQPRPPPA